MRKFIHRSKTWAILGIILLTVASFSPAFAADTNTVDGVIAPSGTDGNIFTAGFADYNVLVNSSSNTFGAATITSDYNELTNSNINSINGSYNVLTYSDSNVIRGTGNILTGDALLKVHDNTITGDENILSNNSYSNTITGDKNKLEDSSYSNTITGNLNDLMRSYSNTVTGNSNQLTDVISSTIVGSNIIMGERENVTAIGDEVVITADNATAVGDNTVVTAENSMALGTGSIADQPNTVSIGTPENPRRITNVADGIDPTDGVNMRQLDAANANNEVMIDRTGALAAALTGIMPLAYDRDARTQIGIGVGNYHGETAVAVGVNHYFNESVLFNVGAAFGGGENMFRGGLTWRMGKTKPRVDPDVYNSEVDNLKYQLQQQQIEVQQLREQVAELASAQKAAGVSK
ncbi:MAG: YadA-like family protein [Synergistota bacterium]|nr:YadA-like family protein [Synergistota bacterium]